MNNHGLLGSTMALDPEGHGKLEVCEKLPSLNHEWMIIIGKGIMVDYVYTGNWLRVDSYRVFV